jgi:two-component sensor histidine kinase
MSGRASRIWRFWRFTPAIALSAAVVLLLAGVVMAVFYERNYKEQKIREVSVQAEILASTVAAALTFNDAEAAQEYVSALRANQDVRAAAVYDESNRLFAGYARPGEREPPAELDSLESRYENGRLSVVSPVLQGPSRIGAVYLQTITEPFVQRAARYGGVGLLVVMASLVVGVLGAAHGALSQTNRQLELRVEERTQELLTANQQLRTEIEERERTEAQKQMLMAELEHRVKNALAVAQALVIHTRASTETMDEFAEAFGGRLRAMGNAQELLVRGSWRGADLGELIAATVRPYLPRREALALAGPPVQLPPSAASSLAMILHELATNAAKYGAWSQEGGRVEADWSLAGRDLALTWREAEGPPTLEPRRRGFGTRMIEHNAGYELNGEATLEFRPEGLVCRISFQLPA